MTAPVIIVGNGVQFLATRASARKVTAEAMRAAGPVIFDWAAVIAVTGAFMSELVAWLAGSADWVTHRGMNEDVRDAYHLARRRAGLE